MSFLTDLFSPKFLPVKIGNYLIKNINDYIEYMRTPCSSEHPFKWGGYLEIIAASILYERPIHVLVMDVQPEFKLCFFEVHNCKKPILLSYEGGDHYNAVTEEKHSYLLSRPGVKELMILSASAMRKILTDKVKFPNMVPNSELNKILGKKKMRSLELKEN